MIAAVASLIGCSSGPETTSPSPPPDTALAAALASAGTGTVPIGTGFGWIGADAIRASYPDGAALTSVARALGPGGGDLVTERATIERRTGVDPFEASQLLTVAASFTTGVRLDGVDAGEIKELLRRSARPRGDRGGWQLFDAGPTGAVPLRTDLAVFGSLGARIALRDDRLIVARTDQARSDLLGLGEPPLK